MKHLLYTMKSENKAPAGHRNQDDWFYLYKWRVEGEVYIPWESTEKLAETGDVLWFSIDAEVIGCALIKRVQEDPLNKRWELWYDGDKVCQTISHVTTADIAELVADVLPQEAGDKWLKEILDQNPIAN